VYFFVLLAAQVSPKDFRPALHHGTQPVAEWVRRIDLADQQPEQAAWCLYYANDRSTPVLDEMRKALKTPEAPAAHTVIDTILTHWGVPFAQLPPEAFTSGAKAATPARPFAPPPGAADGDLAALRTSFASADPAAVRAAGLALLARHEPTTHVLDRLAELVRAGGLLDEVSQKWLRARAGRGWSAAVGKCLVGAISSEPVDQVGVDRLFTELDACGEQASGAARLLVDVALSGGAWQGRAEALVRKVGGAHKTEGPLTDGAFHPWRRNGPEDSTLGPELARYYGARIAGGVPDTVAGLGLEIAPLLQSYPQISAAVEASFLPLLDGGDSVRATALLVLVHGRSTDPRVRSAWLSTARAWSRGERAPGASFPCWPLHDEETEAALLAAMKSPPGPHGFLVHLKFCGLTNADRSPAAKWFLNVVSGDGEGLAWLAKDGFLGRVNEPLVMPAHVRQSRKDSKDYPSTMQARVSRVNALAMEIATRRARGEDFSAEERALLEVMQLRYEADGAGGYGDFIQWAIYQAQVLHLHSEALVEEVLRHVGRELSDDYYWRHAEEALAFLEEADLKVAHQVALFEYQPYRPPGERWRGLTPANARYDGRNSGIVSLQHVPPIRRAVYVGNVKALDELARYTRFAARDLDYFEAVLDYGPAEARAWALRIVDEHDVDSPRVRAAVRGRLVDVDGAVRQQAQTLLDRLEW